MDSSTLTALKGKGRRLTRVRAALVAFLKKHHGPFSAPELLAALKRQGLKVNKTTVYRQLSFLIRRALVQEVHLGDRQARYESCAHGHHHHLVCMKCRTVETVALSQELGRHERIIEKKKKFKINRHALDFFGLCAKCQ